MEVLRQNVEQMQGVMNLVVQLSSKHDTQREKNGQSAWKGTGDINDIIDKIRKCIGKVAGLALWTYGWKAKVFDAHRKYVLR